MKKAFWAIPGLTLLLASCQGAVPASSSRDESPAEASSSPGYWDGYDEGFSDGLAYGEASGEKIGYQSGYQDGYDSGYQQGYEDATGSHENFNPGTNLALHSDLQEEYLQGSYGAIPKFAAGSEELSSPEAIHLDFKSFLPVDAPSYELTISEREDLSSPWTYQIEETTFDLYNCKIHTRYYWRVTAQVGSVVYVYPVQTFTTQSGIIRNIHAEGMSNIRDIGGYSLPDGKKVRQGLIYRSASFVYWNGAAGSLNAEGKKTLIEQLGIKTDIDLAGTGNLLGLESYQQNLMKWSSTDLDGKSILDADCNVESIKQTFQAFADVSNYPIDFHCTRGRDRTGAIAYLLETLLGVSKEDAFKDYLFTNFSGGNYTSPSTLDRYEGLIESQTGATRSEKAASFLRSIGVSEEEIGSIRNQLTE